MTIGVFSAIPSNSPLNKALAHSAGPGCGTVDPGTGAYPGYAHCKPAGLLAGKPKWEAFLTTVKTSGLKLSSLILPRQSDPSRQKDRWRASSGFSVRPPACGGPGCELHGLPGLDRVGQAPTADGQHQKRGGPAQCRRRPHPPTRRSGNLSRLRFEPRRHQDPLRVHHLQRRSSGLAQPATHRGLADGPPATHERAVSSRQLRPATGQRQVTDLGPGPCSRTGGAVCAGGHGWPAVALQHRQTGRTRNWAALTKAA